MSNGNALSVPGNLTGPNLAQKRRASYDYSFYFSALAPAATTTVTKRIQTDAIFDWYIGTYFADIASAAQTESTRVIPICTVLIKDLGSSYDLSDAAIPLTSRFGRGELPYILSQPYRFPSGGDISITVSNADPTNTYNIRLVMGGIKIY